MSELIKMTRSADYQKLVDATPIGMCLIGPNLEHKQANSVWADLLDYTPEELQSISLPQIAHAPDRQTDQAILRFLAEGRPEPIVTNQTWVRRDGSLVRVVMTVSAMSQAGLEGCGLATIVPDANQVFDRLQTRKAAHDLLSLLHAIGLSAEVIRNTATDRFLPDSIMQATTLAASMVTNLLRAEHSTRGSCCAGRVIESCIAIVQATMPAEIRIHRSVTGRTKVAIDETKLSEVVLNLLSNARDALRAAGTIHIHCQERGDFVVLSVRDDGVGMSEAEVQDVIRGLDEKGENDCCPGLGLSMANSIVQSVAGQLSVVSVQGQGTEITCHLPRLTDK